MTKQELLALVNALPEADEYHASIISHSSCLAAVHQMPNDIDQAGHISRVDFANDIWRYLKEGFLPTENNLPSAVLSAADKLNKYYLDAMMNSFVEQENQTNHPA